MTRSHFVKKARKDYPDHDIKKGESYYWWKFRFGGKYFSKMPPKPQQLTQSAFRQGIMDIEELIGNFSPDNWNDIDSGIEEIKSMIQDLQSTTEESLSNMPDSLQQGSTGEMLQSRIDGLSDMESEFDSIDVSEPEYDDGDTPDQKSEKLQERLDEIIGEVQNIIYNGD